MVDTDSREGDKGGGSGTGKDGKKLLVKKRKKRLGMVCDKNCPACKVPCETPFFPTTKKPR